MDADSTTCPPNIYLVGFMGVGKTAIGKRLATQLGFKFIDSDRSIELAQGKSIPEIFAAEGEAAFRQLELEFVESGHPPHRTVVSCGGGLVCQAGTGERLRAKGIVFCLFASMQSILERTARSNNRPLLAGENPEQTIRELLAVREPIYRQAGISVSTEGRGIPDVVKGLIRTYQTHLQERGIDFKPMRFPRPKRPRLNR